MWARTLAENYRLINVSLTYLFATHEFPHTCNAINVDLRWVLLGSKPESDNSTRSTLLAIIANDFRVFRCCVHLRLLSPALHTYTVYLLHRDCNSDWCLCSRLCLPRVFVSMPKLALNYACVPKSTQSRHLRRDCTSRWNRHRLRIPRDTLTL